MARPEVPLQIGVVLEVLELEPVALADVARVVLLVEVHEESSGVVEALAAELTARVSLGAVIITLAQVVLVALLAVGLLLAGEDLLVLDALQTHLHAVLCLHVRAQGLHVPAHVGAHGAAEAPELLGLGAVVLGGEEHAAFLVVVEVRPDALPPHLEVLVLHARLVGADHVLQLAFAGGTAEVALQGADAQVAHAAEAVVAAGDQGRQSLMRVKRIGAHNALLVAILHVDVDIDQVEGLSLARCFAVFEGGESLSICVVVRAALLPSCTASFSLVPTLQNSRCRTSCQLLALPSVPRALTRRRGRIT
mmetsp:Transcript_14352/g.31649  ORF Transcript_14352/g.31649 Transcript_14352/m.31649 type:complete len:307 (-) Transcript_14352:14-934(-)